MAKKPIIIGSRGSDLALWQANFIQAQLTEAGFKSTISIIKTQGDKIQDLSFDKLEGKGFFTKEIEDALLAKTIDLAVHSHKDLPTESPKGLIICAVSEREDPSELLLIKKEHVDEKQPLSLKKNAVVGTSSARRKSQLIALRKDIKIIDLRGNVPTRIEKLRTGNYHAIMLAAAGVERLNIDLSEFHVEKLSAKEFVPAPAQGVLALQIRASDTQLFNDLQFLNHPQVAEKIAVERKVLNLFDGGCQLPLGVYCEKGINEDDVPVWNVWVAKAINGETAPLYTFYEAETTAEMATNVVKHINGIKPCSIFITRNLNEQGLYFQSLKSNGFKPFGHSLIEFKIIPFTKVPKTDWIFFSSKHAVTYFFKQNPIIENQKFGVIGKSTADALRQHGCRAEFIGQSIDTKITGKQFAAKVGPTALVCFPQAKDSMRTVQKQFIKPQQTIDLNVYETILQNDLAIPATDIILFTSPSNAQAFFEAKHTIQPNQQLIAMGAATAAEIKKYVNKKITLPVTFNDLGLLQAVYSIA